MVSNGSRYLRSSKVPVAFYKSVGYKGWFLLLCQHLPKIHRESGLGGSWSSWRLIEAGLAPSTAAPSQPTDLFKHLQLDSGKHYCIFLAQISRQKQLKWPCPGWSGWCWWTTNINFKCPDVVPWLIYSYGWLVNYFCCQTGQNLVLSHPKSRKAQECFGLHFWGFKQFAVCSLNSRFPNTKWSEKLLQDLIFF